MDLNDLERGKLRKLQDVETDFDQNSLWANIEKQQEKRRPIIWWWFGGSACLAIIATAAFFLFAKNSSGEVTAFAEKPSPKFEQIQKLSNNSSELIPQNVSNAILESTEIENSVRTENILSNTKIKDQTSRKIANAHFTEKNGNEPKPKNRFSEINKKINPNSEPKNSTAFAKKQEIESRQSVQKTNIGKLYDPSGFESIALNEQTEIINSKRSEILKKETVSAKNKKSKTNQILDIDQSQINAEIIIPLPQKTSFLKKNFDTELPKIREIEKGQKVKKIKPINLFVSAFAGSGYQFRTLASKNSDSNNQYLNRRKSSEQVLESISFGIDFDKKIGENFLLGTGVEMVIHNEKMSFSEITIDNVSGLAPTDIPDEYAGQSGYLIRSRNDIYYNSHRLVSVPFRVGYSLIFKKIRLAPEVSAVFNISQKSFGHIQNEFEYTTEIAPFFKTKIGIGYRLGCKFLVPTRKRFLLYAKPSFEFNPSDVSEAINPLSQKRNVVRLDLGVSRNF